MPKAMTDICVSATASVTGYSGGTYTQMSVIAFGIAVLAGRMLLFLAIAFGVSALVH